MALQPQTGSKRKSTSNNDGGENGINPLDIDVSGEPLTENPDQVRRKIHRLIEHDGMKVGEFCDTIKVSQNAYRRFVSQSGKTKGAQSDVYIAAAIYFRQREIADLKLSMASSKRAKTNANATAGASASTSASNGGGGGGGAPVRRRTAYQCMILARMCVARFLRTFASPETHRHSSVGIFSRSSMDRTKAPHCKAHSYSASAAALVPIRAEIARCSTPATSSSRRSGSPRRSPSRRRGRRWRTFGRTVSTGLPSEDSGKSFCISCVLFSCTGLTRAPR
jgi:hypothetical protein